MNSKGKQSKTFLPADQRGVAIGIDLGTTYSVAARMDRSGQAESLKNAEGEWLTPSVLLFEGNDVIVGREAAKAVSTDFERVIQCPKRQMGSRLFDKPINGRRYPPEVLQGWVLKKIADDASKLAGPIRDAVVTVPAYFDEVRRKATQDAGFIAGLNIIEIVNEPTAAAIAYGFQQGWIEKSGQFREPQTFLVFDLGGGTFDVTIMQVDRNGFRTLATDGDVQLGGYDWDLRLVDYIAEKFIREHGADPREDPDAYGQLLRDCREAKESLSTRYRVSIKCTHEGVTVKCPVDRDTFHELTRDLLERTSFTTRQSIKAAAMTWDQIDVVLLVGGSTRMPSIRDMLRNLTAKEPTTDISPDEAVAHGAAIRAALLADQYPHGVPVPKIKNVNSHSLGIVAHRVKSGEPQVVRVIPRNTPLPVVSKRTFKTHRPDQESIKVQIVEGESDDPCDCSLIGKCSIWQLPETLPVGTPIEVQFGYRENGRLTIEVNVTGTEKPFRYLVERPNSLTKEQLKSWRALLHGETTPRWKAGEGDGQAGSSGDKEPPSNSGDKQTKSQSAKRPRPSTAPDPLAPPTDLPNKRVDPGDSAASS